MKEEVCNIFRQAIGGVMEEAESCKKAATKSIYFDSETRASQLFQNYFKKLTQRIAILSHLLKRCKTTLLCEDGENCLWDKEGKEGCDIAVRLHENMCQLVLLEKNR